MEEKFAPESSAPQQYIDIENKKMLFPESASKP